MRTLEEISLDLLNIDMQRKQARVALKDLNDQYKEVFAEMAEARAEGDDDARAMMTDYPQND